jgi:NTP pyrophosphatase (non-canonical NTP hydrolase)
MNARENAKSRWAEVQNTTAEPIVHQDIRMMHDYYGVREAVAKLSPEHALAFLNFRFKFLQEEIDEGLEAIDERNSEEVVDALIDLVVVAVGTLDVLGVDFAQAWREVLRANMNKEVGVKESRPNALGLPDLIKLPGWVPPDHTCNHGILPDIL